MRTYTVFLRSGSEFTVTISDDCPCLIKNFQAVHDKLVLIVFDEFLVIRCCDVSAIRMEKT